MLFPILMLLVFGLLQGVFWYHARTVALAAAGSGVAATRTEAGTVAAGRDAATSFVSRAGGADVLDELTVSAQRTSVQVSVTVTGRSVSLLPGVTGPRVSQTASGPVERVTGS